MEQSTHLSTATIPPDGRTHVRHGNLAYDLPTYPTLAAWEARAAHLRRRVLTAAGLWPTPERCFLQPRVTGRVEHGAYAIENVFFESWPGFYVCGNLYRPRGKIGPFPGVLCPHGHWAHGRLEDQERGSIPARCITFARQGYVALAYDMIGYNDSGIQIAGTVAELGDGGPDEGPHKRHFHSPRHFLWGASLLGLQLWNSVRALDYLASLPDVDGARLACTGASGGGTQTFLLCAIDERVRVAAPVNMISAHFQGGCACENAPNLRLDCTNVEIAALMAPRPLLMVSATGDWTVNTPEVEYPAVRAIYRFYGAEERMATVQVDAPHNYNRESREVMYAWFGRWLLGVDDPEALKERPYEVDPPERMRVFATPGCHSEEGTDEESLVTRPETESGRSSLPPVAQNDSAEGVAQNDSAREGGIALPEEALTPGQLTEIWIGQAGAQIEALASRKGCALDAATLHAYREMMGVVYRYALNARLPQASELRVERVGVEERESDGGIPAHRAERLLVGCQEGGEQTPGLLLVPQEPVGAVLVVHPEGVEGAIGYGAEENHRLKSDLEGASAPTVHLRGRGRRTSAVRAGGRSAEGPLGVISIALIHRLLSRRLALLTLDAWGTGALAGLTRDTSVDPFLCFNRSNAALRVQDVLNGIAVLSAGVGPHAQDAPGTGAWSKVTDGVGLNAPGTPGTGAWSKVTDGVGLNAPNAPETGAWSDGRLGAASRILPVHLLGLGQAGLWCLLARALCGAQVARTVVDAAQFACDDDQAWLDALYLPHIRRAGDLHTAAALTVPGALCVHNAAPSFPSEFARQAYRAAGAFDALHIQAEPADTETITDWLMEPFQAKR